jgi:hypothetical protein
MKERQRKREQEYRAKEWRNKARKENLFAFTV